MLQKQLKEYEKSGRVYQDALTALRAIRVGRKSIEEALEGYLLQKSSGNANFKDFLRENKDDYPFVYQVICFAERALNAITYNQSVWNRLGTQCIIDTKNLISINPMNNDQQENNSDSINSLINLCKNHKAFKSNKKLQSAVDRIYYIRHPLEKRWSNYHKQQQQHVAKSSPSLKDFLAFLKEGVKNNKRDSNSLINEEDIFLYKEIKNLYQITKKIGLNPTRSKNILMNQTLAPKNQADFFIKVLLSKLLNKVRLLKIEGKENGKLCQDGSKAIIIMNAGIESIRAALTTFFEDVKKNKKLDKVTIKNLHKFLTHNDHFFASETLNDVKNVLNQIESNDAGTTTMQETLKQAFCSLELEDPNDNKYKFPQKIDVNSCKTEINLIDNWITAIKNHNKNQKKNIRSDEVTKRCNYILALKNPIAKQLHKYSANCNLYKENISLKGFLGFLKNQNTNDTKALKYQLVKFKQSLKKLDSKLGDGIIQTYLNRAYNQSSSSSQSPNNQTWSAIATIANLFQWLRMRTSCNFTKTNNNQLSSKKKSNRLFFSYFFNSSTKEKEEVKKDISYTVPTMTIE